MAKRKKKSDETLVDIVEVKDSTVNFFEENQNIILGVVIGIILIAGAFLAYKNLYQEPRNQEAANIMYQAQFQFERDSFYAALNNPGGGYEGFLEIINNYGGTKAGNLANYYASVCYLNLGEFDTALDYIEDFDAEGDVMPIMKAGVKGDIYSELKEFDNALDAYEDAASYDNDFLTPYYLNKLGRLQMMQNENEQAKENFMRIKREYPESQIANEVEKYF